MNATLKVLMAFVFLGLPSRYAAASPAPETTGAGMMLVLPARPRMVQMGFDFLALRPQLLLAVYQGPADGDDGLMHVWSGSAWLRLRDADYESGLFLKHGAKVRGLYLAGAESDVPWVLQYRPAWAEEMQWIQSPHIDEVVNVLGYRFRLARAEWRWLAGLHDLRLYETAVRRPHVRREEVRPARTAEEARLPLLERRQRRKTPVTVMEPAPPLPRAERQRWREVRVDTPPVSVPDPKPAAPAVVDEPVTEEETVVPEAPDGEDVAEAPDMPALADISIMDEGADVDEPDEGADVDEPDEEADVDEPDEEVATLPGPEDIGEPVKEPEDAAPAVPDEEIVEKGVRSAVAVPDMPPIETPARPEGDPLAEIDVDTPEREGVLPLTPEEIEFFETIRREFPDLQGLPELP